MRKLFIILILCFLSCDDKSIELFDTGLPGRWKLEATKISPGTVVREWTPITNGEEYIFRANGTYELQNTDRAGSGTFEFDEEILTLIPNGDGTIERYYVTFESTKMILGFVGCIEECSYRYRRIF